MFSKIAFLALLVTTAHASGGYSSFTYSVSDPNTGDIKHQNEERVGGNVVGKYDLLEADGTKRVVEYSADDATGFKAVVRKEPVGTLDAASIGGPLTNSGVLSGHLAHGSFAAAGHSAPFAAGSPLATSLAAATPLANGGLANRLAHGGFANPLAYGNTGLAGHAGSLYGGYGNALGAFGYAGRGEPTVSSYSHSIIHNGPDAYPYSGAYGRYGGNGYGAHGSSLNGAALENPWVSGAGITSGLASPLAASAYGGYATGLEHGNRLGW